MCRYWPKGCGRWLYEMAGWNPQAKHCKPLYFSPMPLHLEYARIMAPGPAFVKQFIIHFEPLSHKKILAHLPITPSKPLLWEKQSRGNILSRCAGISLLSIRNRTVFKWQSLARICRRIPWHWLREFCCGWRNDWFWHFVSLTPSSIQPFVDFILLFLYLPQNGIAVSVLQI